MFTSRANGGSGETMSIPPEIAWVVPIVVPFIIGLLVGAVVKRVLKLVVFVVALVVILVATGVLSLTYSGLFSQAMQFLPKIYDVGRGILNVLPYSSLAFLLGFLLALWLA